MLEEKPNRQITKNYQNHEILYAKYDLTNDEIAIIEKNSVRKP